MKIFLQTNLLLCLVHFSLIAQESKVQNPLTLSIVEEPVTLQKSRIRAYIGYQFETFNNYFSASGDKSEIINYNMTSNMNQLQYFIEYGLTDRLQIGLYNIYKSGYEGYLTEWRKYYDHILNKTAIKKSTGFEDILINIGYNFRSKSKMFELALLPGIYLPMSNKPHLPRHIISPLLNYDITGTNIDETNYEKEGTGSFRFDFATKAKLRLKEEIALQTFIKYDFPINEAQTIEWETIYNGSIYSYERMDALYSPPSQFYGNLEFLIVPDKKEIMGLTLGIEIFTASNAWKEVGNSTIDIPNLRLISTYASLELVVTKNIRFTQQLSYDIAGRNTKSAFGSKTSFTFNFMKNE